MYDKLSKSILLEFRSYLLTHLGLNFSEKQEKELMQKIELAAKDFGYNETFEFIEWILNNNISYQQISILASYLTIGETYFLREKKSFDFLEQVFIPKLIQKKEKQLRIWSAGCASGEEPYSIAITLLRTIRNISNWNISILATDINPNLLKKAEKGIYSNWSFRNNPDWFSSNYFKKIENNLFQIIPEVKNMVRFSTLNLAKDQYPSLINNTNAMDIIFCRNVMIYFSQNVIKEVISKLYKSLVPGGILIVSPVETSNFLSQNFSRIDYYGHSIYQKPTKEINSNRHTKVLSTNNKTDKAPFNNYDKTNKNIVPKNTVNIEHNKISDYEQAFNLFNQGLFEQAENILINILNTPENDQKQAILLLAKTKANLGKLDDARTLCEKGLEIDKTDYRLYFLLATLFQEQGNDNEAILLLKKALYLDHNFAMAHFLLGNINIKKGYNESGIKYFNNAINILSHYNINEIVPESDELTVGRFTEIISVIKSKI